MSFITSGLGAQERVPEANTDSVAGAGLRSGLQSAGAGLSALAGTGLEALGANDLAQKAYGASRGLRESASQARLPVQSYKDVHDMDSAAKYGVGLLSQSVPALGAGLAGAAATRNPLVGASLATAPFSAGDIAVRQQEDPEIAQRSAGERLGEAAGTGLRSAVVQNIVPVALGGKLLGRTGATAARSLGASVATNVAEGVGGNAAAGALAEGMTQASLTNLNPNRDTSGDRDAMLEAAVGGAAVGVPFAGLGVAGDRIHGTRPAPRTDGVAIEGAPVVPPAAEAGPAGPGPDAPVPSTPAPARESILTRMRGMFEPKADPLADARKVADGLETVDPEALSRAGPERQEQILQQADKSRMDQVNEWAREIASDGELSPDNRAAFDAAMTDLSDRANQATVAGMKVARDVGRKAADSATEFYDHISKKYDAGTKGETLSEDSGGLRAAIDNVVSPILAERMPELAGNKAAMQNVSDSLRKFMLVTQKSGTIDEATASHLTRLFGDETPTVLAELHSSVMQGADPKATDRYFGALNKMTSNLDAYKGLTDLVKSSLTKEAAAKATPEMIDASVRHIRDFVSGTHTNGPKAQAEFMQKAIDSELRKSFGGKTDAVLEAFNKERKTRLGESKIVDDRAGLNEDGDAPDGGFADAAESRLSERNVADEAQETQYLGGGKDKANPQPIMSDSAHKAQGFTGESQAERVLAQARIDNPDSNVSFTRLRDLPDDVRAKHPDADPESGFVTIDGTKSETNLTPREFEGMRVDTSKTSHAQNNASRIDTGVKGAVLDARAIVKQMQGKLSYSGSDDISARHRTARAFIEGIAAAQQHIGQAFNIPDSTVLDGGGFTYGEARKLSFREPDPAWMKGKTDEEINQQIKRNETLGDMSDNELTKAHKNALDVVEKREAAMQAHVKDLKAGGTRVLKEDFAEMRKTFGVDKAREAVNAAESEQRKRSDAVRKEKNLEDASRREADPNENVVVAKDHLGEKGIARKTGLDGAALRYDNFEANKGTGEMKDSTRSAIETKINGLENMRSEQPMQNKVAQRIAEKARVLMERFDTMSKMDQALMASIVKDKKLSSLSETINELHTRYAARPSNGAIAAKRDAATLAGKFQASSGDMLSRYARQLERAKGNTGAATRATEVSMKVPPGGLKDLAGIYERMNPSAANDTGGPAVKKPSAFAERVLAGGETAKIIDSIKRNPDARLVQKSIDALANHADNSHARAVLEAANERMATLARDADVAYNLQRPGQTKVSAADMADVQAHIEKVLGKTVDAEFTNLLHEGEFVRDPARAAAGMAEDVIRISVNSLDPMSTAHHESLHAFFAKLRDQGLMDDASPLLRAADSSVIKTKLRALLRGEPDALKQVERSLEERAAYMYQFWATGKLEVGGKPAGVLEKMSNFFRKMLGLWTNDERALHIMEHFRSGEYAKEMTNRSAVQRSLLKGTSESLNKFQAMVKPLTKVSDAVFAIGDARLRDSNIPALVELADKVFSPLTGEHGDAGYIPTARTKRTQVMNDLATNLHGYTEVQINGALEALQRRVPGGTPEERLIMRDVRKTLDSMYEYMNEAGVKMGDLGYGKDYFPRVWDANSILSNEQAFRDMLQQYKDAGKFDGSIDQVLAALTRADGSELTVETAKPGMQFSKERVLGFIRGEDAAPFLQKNLYQTLNSYVTQGTRRAEWARRFNDDGSALNELITRARKEGATDEHIQTATDYLQGVDGTLGDSINPKLRRAFGNAIVYQNVRLLPLAIFSSLIDPLGIAVRGGTAGEAWSAFSRGIREIPQGFKKERVRDEWTKLAETMGVIDNTVLMHTLGSSYSQGMVSDTGRKINDVFFKYNLMEQYNISMRVGATEAAVSFLGRHADGSNSTHSERWLAELGLKPSEMTIKNGRPLLTYAEFKADGRSDAVAQAMADKMTLAVNKWVDGAVLRPNAAHKPIWMNDPHFALISHLKQFVYSFQETILKRVVNETRYGNLGPAYAMASYIPFMIAADLMKGMIVGGGSQPDYKEGWDAGDYLWSGVQRAGVFGVGQFGLDAVKDVHRGGLGIGALAGPSIEQLGDAISTIAGPQQFSTFALNSLPANQLFDAAGEAVSTNASE